MSRGFSPGTPVSLKLRSFLFEKTVCLMYLANLDTRMTLKTECRRFGTVNGHWVKLPIRSLN